MDEASVLRRRYSAALRAGRMGTFEYDPGTGHVHWDEAFEDLLGVEPSSRARTMADYTERVHPSDLGRTIENARACADGRISGYEHEYRMLSEDGAEVWVRASVVRIQPPGGVPRLVGVVADITDRHRAEVARAAAREAERQARSVAATSQRRLELLAEVASLLEAPLDVATTLQAVAELATGVLGDWCVVDLVDPGRRVRVAIAHHDPGMRPLAEEYQRRWPPAVDDPMRESVLRTLRPVHVPVVTDDLVEQNARDPDHLNALRRFRLSSFAVVPVQAGGQVLGLLSVAATHGRWIGEEDVELAVELGRRAGAAVERVRLHADRERVANALQRALLPPALPTIPGVDLAAAYEPAGGAAAIGGDFYDAVRAGADRWWIVLGDVQGKGPEAAAVTGAIRYVLRTVVHDSTDPAEVLERARVALEHQGLDQRTASVVLATFRAGARPLTVQLASAGHPPPLLRRGDGTVVELPGGGLLLGLGDSVGATTFELSLQDGDVLLLYTDGVTDAPLSATGRLEEHGLRSLVAGAHGKPSAVVDAVVAQLRGGPAARRDDVALFALALTP